MITIYNRQRKVFVDIARMEADAECILDRLGYNDFELSIVITNDATIRRYNKTYRSFDKPTDILSFPFYTELRAGERIVPVSEEERILGDLIISAPYVVRDAERYGVSFEERMRVLLVHGIFHLLGYDHITDADYEEMHAQEEEMLAYLASSDCR